MMRRIAVNNGHILTAAGDAAQGLKLLSDQLLPDIILVDLNLPDMDGLTIIRQIREAMPQMPIIAITAYAMSGDEQKCLQAGANEYVAKPIRVEAISQLLKRHETVPQLG